MRHNYLLRTVLGAFMILAGINHFINPAIYGPMIPDGKPKDVVNYGTGALEIALGIGVFLPRYRRWAALGILLLMVMFLPVHLIDYSLDYPAIGSKMIAAIRIPVQFLLIGWAWWVHKQSIGSTGTGR